MLHPFMYRQLIFATRALLLLAASCAQSGPEACVAAGGECVLGGGPCYGIQGPQDCNPPPVNPGGAFCCLPCPAGQTPIDAGYAMVSGCH
jgi:hypothetical protein